MRRGALTGNRLIDIGFGPATALRIDAAFWLPVTLACVAAIYWLGVRGMHLVRNSPPTRDLPRRPQPGMAVYGDSRRVSLWQRWMLLVMVGFTCLGLFLLSRANA